MESVPINLRFPGRVHKSQLGSGHLISEHEHIFPGGNAHTHTSTRQPEPRRLLARITMNPIGRMEWSFLRPRSPPTPGIRATGSGDKNAIKTQIYLFGARL